MEQNRKDQFPQREDDQQNPQTGRTEQNDRANTSNPTPESQPDQGRADYKTGSTTQGGSNHGQGSSQLGGASYKQGDEKSKGSNYDNEAGRLGNTTDATTGFAAHTKAAQQNVSSEGEGDDKSRQSGGGASGYDVSKEQEQVNKEREDMNSERDLGDLNIERKQTPDTNPDRNSPGQTPQTPGTTGRIGD